MTAGAAVVCVNSVPEIQPVVPLCATRYQVMLPTLAEAVAVNVVPAGARPTIPWFVPAFARMFELKLVLYVPEAEVTAGVVDETVDTAGAAEAEATGDTNVPEIQPVVPLAVTRYQVMLPTLAEAEAVTVVPTRAIVRIAWFVPALARILELKLIRNEPRLAAVTAEVVLAA